MAENAAYVALANKLDSYPQGFPSTEDGKELQMLAYLFTPEEAHLASYLDLNFTSLQKASELAGIQLSETRDLVKSMAEKGLIYLSRSNNEMSVILLPFVVGFFENQVERMDQSFAQLFEEYYSEASKELLSVSPQFHRVIPVHESISTGIEILPEEDVSALVASKKAWAVSDYICRKQRALIGQGCDHPLKVCLVLSDTPGVFEGGGRFEVLDLQSALDVLEQAAQAGLVHTISNQKADISYVCNCCTCSCGILRGIAESGMSNVVARSAYFSVVDDESCIACGICEDACQFGAISVDAYAEINPIKCVGCGVCVRVCPEGAISLHLRSPEDILEIPENIQEWGINRMEARRKSSLL
jgi:ferredoxin